MAKNSEQNAYGATTTSLNGQPITPGSFTSPATLFSNPSPTTTRGAFSRRDPEIKHAIQTLIPVGKEIANTKRNEGPENTNDKKIARIKNLVPLLITIGELKQDMNTLFFRDEFLALPLKEQEMIKKDYEEALLAITSNTQAQIDNPDIENPENFDNLIGGDIESFDQKIEELAQRIEDIRQTKEKDLARRFDRSSCLNVYSELFWKADELNRKANVDRQALAQIHTSLESVSWLENDISSNPNISKETIDNLLSLVRVMITVESERLGHDDNKTATERAKVLEDQNKKITALGHISDAALKIGILEEQVKALLSKKISDDDKKLLKETLSEVTKKYKHAGDKLIEEDIAELLDLLTTSNDYVKELAASAVKIESLTIDVWSGWPEKRFHIKKADSKNGVIPHWIYFANDGGSQGKPQKLSQDESTAWEREKDNFDRVFSDYKQFFVKDLSKKTLAYRSLIDAKNALIEAIANNDISLASTSRELFRLELERVEKEWSEKVHTEETLKPLVKKQKELEESFEGCKKLIKKLEAVESFKKTRATFTPETQKLTNWLTQLDTTLDKNNPLDSKVATLQINAIEEALGELQNKIKDATEKLVDKDRTILRSPFNTPQAATSGKHKNVQEVHLRKARLAGGVMRRKFRKEDVLTKIITQEEWDKMTSLGGKSKEEDVPVDEENVERSQKVRELEVIHREMFTRDGVTSALEYERLYVGKGWFPEDEITREVVEKLLKERLNGLLKEQMADQKEVRDLEADILLNSDDYAELERNVIAREAERLVRKIEARESEINFLSGSGIQPFLETDTSSSIRETYSPMHDSSIDYIKRNGQPNTWRERARIKRALKGRAELIKKSGLLTPLEGETPHTRNIRMQEELKAYNPDPKNDDGTPKNHDETNKHIMSPLSERSVPSHHDGMIRSLDKGDVTRRDYFTTQHETPPEEVLPQTSVAREPAPAPRTDLEEITRKQTAVKKLIEAINNNKIKSALAVLALSLASGYAVYQKSPKNSEEKPKTLGEEMIKTSWRDLIQDQRDKLFLQKLKESPPFERFAVSSLPSLVSLQNLSTVKALSDMQCLKLFEEQRDVYGLTSQQRKAVCEVVQQLERIVQYTEAIKRRVDHLGGPFKQSPYSFSDGVMTVKELYEKTLWAIQESDKRELDIRNASRNKRV